jgi:Uma2 family endonuclease
MATVSFSMPGSGSVELPLRQFDADEYMAMVGAGVFEPRGRVELIGGYVVDMSPANSDHNYIVMRFIELFVPLMPQFKVWVQGTLHVDRRNVFDPDFMLLRSREQSYRDALPTPADVALLIEAAGSSLRKDTGVKLPIYAKNGIQDYWIADLDREVLIVHRQPSGKAYADRQEYAAGSNISPLAAPEFSIAVANVFA